ncbi:Mitochondrial transcription termination factor family protein, putative isoform 1 [Hibiscus syriacus]|uniref:Mitochondrial transcription termination factor family protein, putative isoform 1 n=2 Tax=Hibiscus syriacus TaxID=106335 RepID=A0A6A2X0U2_HIBSY|nr:Mitochondrial transcription termination factor family protein, putative isoform 1 [Hibiscus syriacus]
MVKEIEVFEKFGLSEEELLETFRRNPLFIRYSDEKLMITMDFLVNKMGFSSRVITKRTQLVQMSMEKKIVPRGLFALDLLSKGVINRINLQALLECSDRVFIDNFINHCRRAEASQLLKLYHEKLLKVQHL